MSLLPTALVQRYKDWTAALPAAVRGQTTQDLKDMEALVADAKATLRVRVVATSEAFSVRMFSTSAQLTLAEMMPVVESFRLEALREDVVALNHKGGNVWLHVLTCANPSTPVSGAVAAELESAMEACLKGRAEVDSLNSLVRKGLPFKAVHVVRGLIAYAQQLDGTCNPWQMRKMLRHYPAVAVHVWQVLEAKHDPALADHARAKLVQQVTSHTKEVLATLPDVAHDRMATMLVDVAKAVIRMNFWQNEHAKNPTALAFKVECAAIPSMPNPRPWREMFVYGGGEFEGIHLRGGPVARGGIRHSDRTTDYRTEVLGLQQTQVRKNVIIVPTGAKGGFVVKLKLPPHREEAQTAIRHVYASYIRAMLSLTDNRVGAVVVHPRDVVCHDGFDPYFVVAADKGTATFSDLANATAQAADFWDAPKGVKTKAKGFWLGDAFASGGSKGYDHKEMGITSRGAWISVAHHLAALGCVPSAKAPISIIGIGDMAGDVFGNGLLREPHAKLLAAFNHKHIFIDPTPDPKVSYGERARMFKARLGWDGYDVKKLSKGGAVLLRDAKVVELSPQAQDLLGLRSKLVPPAEVMQAILRMDADVLWNGGIGTYIKATVETHAEVADRANDAVRVNAREVKARVIGEGGNLGLTPRARVELALQGTKLNTDALDNSAGVSTSDHEVNIKILLEDAKAKGLLTEDERLALLPKLTEDIAALVLADNRLQNMTLTLAEQSAETDHADILAWQQELVRRGIVDDITDNLPTPEALKQRAKPHFTRPELAAVMAGTKRALREHIAGKLDYNMPMLQGLLRDYFPERLHKKFGTLIEGHPLAHEILDTLVTNLIINRCGLVMGQRLQADLGCTPVDAINARLVALGLLDLIGFWKAFDEIAETLPMATRVEAAMRWRVSIFTLAGWVLAHGQPVDVTAWLEGYYKECAAMVRTLARTLPTHMLADTAAWQKQWAKQGLPHALAERLGHLSASTMVPQAALIAKRHNLPLPKVFTLFMDIGEELNLPALVRKLRTLPIADKHTRSALYAMERETQARQASLTEQLLHAGLKPSTWGKACGPACLRYHTLVREFMKLANPTMAMAVGVLGRLRELDVR